MILALRAIWGALYSVSTHFLFSVTANLVAMVLSVPVLLAISVLALGLHHANVLPFGVALFIGILPNPATAGLHVGMRNLLIGDYITVRVQWEALKEYHRAATKTWLTSAALSIALAANLIFYVHLASSGGASFRIITTCLALIWAGILYFWICMHLYVFPLLLQQESRRIVVVYRNASLMVLSRPLFTSIVAPVWVLVVLFASASGLATVIGLAVSVAIQHSAFTRLLPQFKRA
ncbi:MAG: hypothetical protein NVSMB52_08070 [Chloroflexota bacterium]